MLQKISEPLKHSGDNLGNKGKFLCLMHQAGFEVPDGVILECEEYYKFLDENGIRTELEGLLETLTKENLSDISHRIQALFEGRHLPESTRAQLVKELDDSEYYAVRSSGSKEDLQEYSFAGQYETYLNVQGMNAVENAVIACYKSMFSEVLLNYLVNQTIDYRDLAMAVVIQKMVPAQFSGICFTVNPITGNDKEMSIEVAEGLGENIVSGKVAPEQYDYNWYEKRGSFAKSNRFLTDEQLVCYGETFLKIQLLFGYPCDIEFAIKDGKLYILQARRITKMNYGGLKDIWSTADFKDGGVSASVCTPYMWSLYEYIWEFTLRKFMLDSKILKPAEVNRKLGDMFYGRCYWNLSMVKLAMSKVIGYKEREFDSEYGVRITYEGDGQTTKLTPGSLIAIARMFFAQKKILKERNDNHDKYKADLLKKYYTYKEKYDKRECKVAETADAEKRGAERRSAAMRDAAMQGAGIQDIRSEWYQLTKKTYLQSEATYFWQIFINTIHQSLYKDSLLKYVSESEYLTLLGAIDNISHMLPFYDMWEISREIREKEEYAKIRQSAGKPEERSATLEMVADIPAVKKLIDTYGYHSDKELDVTYPCYYEDSTPFLTGILDMVTLGEEFSPLKDKQKGEERYQKILADIEAKVGKRKYKKIHTKIMNMRKMLWWREEYRDISTRFYYIIRVYTMELAKTLKAEGVLQTEDDIWFLKVGVLWDYLDGKVSADDLQKMVASNREYYNAYANYMSENEIGGNFGVQNDSATKAGGDGENSSFSQAGLKGLGANSGVVRGTARVIEDFSQIGRLQENDILVTRFTDTGWTPKFAILSGIVTEYGGILCHAAIVSREYGIPAIVSCHDAMKKIKDGQTITIDGATGCITIED